MRKIIFAAVLGVVFSLGAYSAAEANHGNCGSSHDDPCGGWVKVDAGGTVISGPVVCAASVCGAGTLYSQLTLKDGEQWVQQTKADPVTGNVAGIGNNNPGTTVTYDRTSETFTVVVESPNPAPTDSNPQPTQSALQPEATSVPQATAEPTQSAPQPTATAAPTDAPTAVPVAPVVTVVPVPTVDPSVDPYTYEFKLSDTADGYINWRPKRRVFGEMIAI